jgi:hypothetical protein
VAGGASPLDGLYLCWNVTTAMTRSDRLYQVFQGRCTVVQGTRSAHRSAPGAITAKPRAAALARGVHDRRAMKRTLVVIVALLASACVNKPSLDSTSAALGAGARGCFDPADYGAIPDDGIDDSVPAQRAIDDAAINGGEVCFGPGTWDLTRAPVGSYDRFAALSWHAPHVAIRGASMYATTLRVAGDQGAATTNVLSIDPGANGASISDLVIDTSGMTNTDEQTHAIAIGTGVCSTANGTCALPVADATVQRVRFIHPVNAGERKGDCVRLLGNLDTTPVINAKLLDLDFRSCARSGVSVQRNVQGLIVSRSFFDGDNIGGTMFDGEATGGGWDKGLVVSDNLFVRTQPGGDAYGLTLTSQTHYAISHNLFLGRGLFAYRTTDGTIDGNVVDSTDALDGTGDIEFGNQTERITIANNTARRRGLSGSIIKLQPHSGGLPSGIAITGNTLQNDTDGTGVFLHSPIDVSVTGNQITGNGGPNSMAIYVAAISRAVENVSISGNTIRGEAFAGVRLAGSATFGFAATVVGLNTSRTSGPGLRCDNPASTAAGSISRGLNNWSTPEVCTVN